MFTQFILIICRIFLFYILGAFVLSAAAVKVNLKADVKASVKIDSYCDKDYYCYKEYTEKFKSGSISRIFLKKKDMTEVSKERLRTGIKNRDCRKTVVASYPDYSLEFSIVGEHQAVNIKQVIFDGIKATPSIFELFEPSWQLAEVRDFQMGPVDVNCKFLKFVFPMSINNTFTIRLKKRLVDKLRAQPRIKITLISHNNKKFIVETDNFIKKYSF
ncbi:hypothetical protein [Borrelia turicatae]|uniref:hypothetical protein n=1 Tax=Borrelia turicatae TaxID=142 RepID=UPI002ECFF5FB